MKKIISVICLFVFIFSCFGCGKTEEEERKDAELGKELANATMMIAGAPIVYQRVAFLIKPGSVRDKDIKDIDDFIEKTKECYKALDGSPKKMKYLGGWKDFRSEALGLVEDETDLLKEFKKILEKIKNNKNVNSDLNDYIKDVGKYEKRYKELEVLQKRL